MILATIVCGLLHAKEESCSLLTDDKSVLVAISQESGIEAEAVRFLRATGVKPDASILDLKNKTVKGHRATFGSDKTGSISMSSATGKVTSFTSNNSDESSWGRPRSLRNVFGSEAEARLALTRMAKAIGIPAEFQLMSFKLTEDKYEPRIGKLVELGQAWGQFWNPAATGEILNSRYSASISLDVYDGSLSGYNLTTRIVKVDRAVNVTKERAREIATDFVLDWLVRRGLVVHEVKFGYAVPKRPTPPDTHAAFLNACPAWQVFFNDQPRSYVIVDATSGLVIVDGRF